MAAGQCPSDNFRFWHEACAIRGHDVRHRHAAIEIHFCHGGAGFFHTTGQRRTMQPGVVTLIFGPIFHRVTSRAGKKYCRTVLHIPSELINKSLYFLDIKSPDFLPSQSRPMIQFVPQTRDYIDLKRIYRQIQRKQRLGLDHSDPTITLYLTEILYIISRAADITDKASKYINPHDELIVRRVEEIIWSEASAGLSVNTVADRIGVSRGHLWRVFSDVLGMSPAEYLLNCRMESAKSNLLAGMSVLEVAAKSGYDNASSFSRAFKSYMGVSPTTYLHSHSGT